MGEALTDDQLTDAIARGVAARRIEVRVASARYDSVGRRIVVELTNGCTFSFPPHVAPSLQAAGPEQLAAIEVGMSGYGLHWTVLDVHLSVSGLMAGSFGASVQMDDPAVHAASRKTDAKSKG